MRIIALLLLAALCLCEPAWAVEYRPTYGTGFYSPPPRKPNLGPLQATWTRAANGGYSSVQGFGRWNPPNWGGGTGFAVTPETNVWTRVGEPAPQPPPFPVLPRASRR